MYRIFGKPGCTSFLYNTSPRTSLRSVVSIAFLGACRLNIKWDFTMTLKITIQTRYAVVFSGLIFLLMMVTCSELFAQDQNTKGVEITSEKTDKRDLPVITAVPPLVQTIQTSLWDPPSPDPSGGAYIQSSNNLLISDGEVNEMAIFDTINVWEITLSGVQVQEFTTFDLPDSIFSDEPTGVAYNPDNDHLYFTDDTGIRRVYEMNPGPDGLYDTADDTITSFKTADFGSTDPEGIAYDTFQGHLFIADGVMAEIYEISPGTNGEFDGVLPPGDDVVVDSFDTAILGLNDPEGVEFNFDNGNLYIVSQSDNIIVETTRSGVYVQDFDFSSYGVVRPAGLAYAPNSANPAERSIYLVDRGVDNDNDPNENDGRIFEFNLGPLTPRLVIDDVMVIEGDAGTVNAIFTVSLSGVSQQVTVDYATADGTATEADNDYVATSGQVTFQPGETSQPITVVVNSDLTDEPDETFFVNLSNATNADIGDDQGIGTITNDDSPDPVTVSFQDGVNGYNGTRDTKLRANFATTNYGTADELELDGDPDESAILFWDLTNIPVGSIIQSVDITVNITNTSGATYEIYDLKQSWIESEATWNDYATGQSWEVAGADGSGDRGSTEFGTIDGDTLGASTVSLNAAGVAIVQSWVDDPSSNQGFIIQDYVAATNSLDFSSRETTTIADRPKITVTYLPAITQVLVETKLFLEGPYDAIGDTMNTDLKDDDVIPLTSPYSEDPRTADSFPEDITDWVLVQLRETDSGAAVASKSAFLRNDGRIVADDGTTEQITMDVAPGNYYIVIEHRNHLAVMSANSVPLSSGSSTLYDFSTGTGQYYGSAAKELETGVFGMYTGDANGNNQVQNDDKNVEWASQVGAAGYRGADFNLNGQVQNDDKNIFWNANVGAGTQVP
jgi:hypothetical protein